jgi:uncharacterized protein YeaO (DUF488 family)
MSSGKVRIRVKRVYDPPGEEDGYRILVDRLWPRGLRKEEARVDLWLKEVAPSDQLRQWFSHDPSKWEEFKRMYFQELRGKRAVETLVKVIESNGLVTLLFSASDRERNNAVALLEYLKGVLRLS